MFVTKAYMLVPCISTGGARGGQTESFGSQVAAWGAWNAIGAAEEDLTTADAQTREFIQFSVLETDKLTYQKMSRLM
jgi:hypothetical protein